MEKILIRFLTFIARYSLAIVFIFSGFVKGIDPLGLYYKLNDYFIAFDMSFMEQFALPLSFALCAAELLIGLLLLLNIRVKLAIWGVFLFMLFFTPLTFFIAIANPVSDCGCFGDAIILSNWDTFFKNIVFMAAATLLFLKRKYFSSEISVKWEWSIALILLLISLLPPIHGYRNLPLIDFRPYSIGTNILDAMSIPPDAPVDVYKTTLFYEKNGEVKEFTEDNFPWQDSTWKFVDSQSILIRNGYSPSITDFTLISQDGWNVSDTILTYHGYYLLAISHKIENVDEKAVDKLNQIYYKAKSHDFGFAMVTSSPESEIDNFVNKTGVAFPFLQADEIMLKTVIRANPGLILLKSGTIIGKWHHRGYPNPSFFEGNIDSKLIKQYQDYKLKMWIAIFVLSLTILFQLISYLRKKVG